MGRTLKAPEPQLPSTQDAPGGGGRRTTSPPSDVLVPSEPHVGHSFSGGGSHTSELPVVVVEPPPPDELLELELLELDDDWILLVLDEENELDDELEDGEVLLELEDDVAPEEEELPWLELDEDELGNEELLVLDEEELLSCDELDEELLVVEVELLELVGTLELEELVGGGGVCEELLELVGGGGVCEELLEVEDELLELGG